MHQHTHPGSSKVCKLMAMAAILCSSMALVSTPVIAQETGDAPSSWLSYRGDLQNTGHRDIALGALPNLIWQFTSTDDPQPLYAPPLIAGSGSQRRAYFAAGDKVYCLDVATGASLWETAKLSSNISSPLYFQSSDSRDTLFAITSDGNMLAIDPVRGKILATLPLGATVQNVAPVPVQTAGGSRLIVGTVSGKLLAVNATDPAKMTIDPQWEVTLGRYGAAITTTPTLTPDGEYLYAPAQDGKLYVVDISKGSVYYPISFRFGIIGSPVIVGSNVVVANGPLITCVKLNGGQTRWAMDLGTLMQTAPAVFADDDGGTVYAGTSTGTFFALNLENGKILWKTNLGDAVTGAPTALRDIVLVGTQRGMFFGLDPNDKGHIKWQYRLDTERKAPEASERSRSRYRRSRRNRDGQEMITYPVSTAPSVVGEHIYIAADNLAVYAFSTAFFDAGPPLLQNLKPYVNNTLNELQDVSASSSIPGRPPVVIKGKLNDSGSGVDPASIKVLLNGSALPPASIQYDALTGEIELHLTQTADDRGKVLDNGRVTIEVQASDYRGNRLEGKNGAVTIRINNNKSAPEPTESRDRRRRRWRG